MRPGTHHHINTEQGNTVGGTGSLKKAKDSEIAPAPTVMIPQEQQDIHT